MFHMTQQQAETLIDMLHCKGIIFTKGLSPEELAKIDDRFGTRFPPDLQLFLQTTLPVSKGFITGVKHWYHRMQKRISTKHYRSPGRESGLILNTMISGTRNGATNQNKLQNGLKWQLNIFPVIPYSSRFIYTGICQPNPNGQVTRYSQFIKQILFIMVLTLLRTWQQNSVLPFRMIFKI